MKLRQKADTDSEIVQLFKAEQAKTIKGEVEIVGGVELSLV